VRIPQASRARKAAKALDELQSSLGALPQKNARKRLWRKITNL